MVSAFGRFLLTAGEAEPSTCDHWRAQKNHAFMKYLHNRLNFAFARRRICFY
jgi:hypothetical protein